ncbi:MAG: serine/threonine protein kinase [bacterium]|nr:serine/threonine protein kinase [bacterium]
MAYGGYWDKLGNRFEDRWTLHQLILMTGHESEIESLEHEPVGEDELGVDLWVNRRDGRRECHQCKRAKEGQARWSMGALDREGIFGHLKFQLDRDPSHLYRLISGTPAIDFESLLREARDSRDAETLWLHQVKPHHRLRLAFTNLCKYLQLESNHDADRLRAWDLLRRSGFILFRDDEHSESSLADRLGSRLEGDTKKALALLDTWCRSQLRRRIDLNSVSAHLRAYGFRLIRGDTDRFRVAGSALARKRAQQGKLPKFEAELAELKRQAAEQGNDRIQVIGEKWRLLRPLGRGGIAEVWLGEEAGLTHPILVAIKILRADKLYDRALLQRFVHGAERIQEVTHHAITRVLYGPARSDGRHYYVMEYVKNARTLEYWTEERRLPFAEGGSIIEESTPCYSEALWRVISTAANGLSALHKADLVHGDVKPANILVDEAGRVKLCDFDLVQLESHREFRGDRIGTMPFLAPEVRGGRAGTSLSDQFSFAMTLGAILSGGSLRLNRIGLEPAELVNSLSCSLPLKRCLEKALSLDPQLRYESIEDLMSGLRPEDFGVHGRGRI